MIAFALVRNGIIVAASEAFALAVGRPLAAWLEESGLSIAQEERIELDGVELSAVHLREAHDAGLARALAKDRMMTVGTLAAGVAHEINNPLSYVIGNLSFLSEESSALFGDRADVLEALAEAREGADRVRRIVRDLQMFARADHQVSRSIDVRRTVELAINMAWIEIRHRARLVKELAEVPPVEASEARLGQVFLSVLLFAAQALPEGIADKHTIRVSTREDDGVIVEIADTGPGIGEEQIASLFDPLARGGAGLAIAETIVRDLGGALHVESSPNSGTLFRITLPKAQARTKAVPVQAINGVAASIGRARVLVVDDEPLIASSLKRTLRDHDVTVVSSGRGAIEVLEGDHGFDLVFCDLMMPELTGMDVYEWLQRARPGMEARMVFITGGTFTPRASAFLESIPNMRFEKPFELDKVRWFVRDYLAARPATP